VSRSLAWNVFFFSPHVQPLHESPDTADAHTQATLRLQPVGHLGQGQVVLFLKPTLHLGAGGRIDLRRAARPFPVGFQCAGAAVQPQQLLDERQAHTKELRHVCL
jgi:hypothetical protein